MAKLKPNEKRVQLSFVRPEDVALFEWMSAKAYDNRHDLGTFVILALHAAFEDEIKKSVREQILKELGTPAAGDTGDQDPPPEQS